jgi:WD40 repeat protein
VQRLVQPPASPHDVHLVRSTAVLCAIMQVACTIPDAHARPVQRLVQPPASPFVSHPREVHELFASSAPDGVVKLWDVRSGSSSCVRSFTGHKNSQVGFLGRLRRRSRTGPEALAWAKPQLEPQPLSSQCLDEISSHFLEQPGGCAGNSDVARLWSAKKCS